MGLQAVCAAAVYNKLAYADAAATGGARCFMHRQLGFLTNHKCAKGTGAMCDTTNAEGFSYMVGYAPAAAAAFCSRRALCACGADQNAQRPKSGALLNAGEAVWIWAEQRLRWRPPSAPQGTHAALVLQPRHALPAPRPQPRRRDALLQDADSHGPQYAVWWHRLRPLEHTLHVYGQVHRRPQQV